MTMSDICFIKKGRERERGKERTRGWERERERESGEERLLSALYWRLGGGLNACRCCSFKWRLFAKTTIWDIEKRERERERKRAF